MTIMVVPDELICPNDWYAILSQCLEPGNGKWQIMRLIVLLLLIDVNLGVLTHLIAAI